MAATEKLISKLLQGTINAKELRTLLKQKDWRLNRVRGSHEIWCKGSRTFVLATHSKDLKPYQRKEARDFLIVEEGQDGKEKI